MRVCMLLYLTALIKLTFSIGFSAPKLPLIFTSFKNLINEKKLNAKYNSIKRPKSRVLIKEILQ